MDAFEVRQASGISRRSMLLAATTTALVAPVVEYAQAQAQTSSDPLASWNEGPAKQAILDFVRDTVNPSSKKFVPPEQRVATFDQDGTLWVEQPLYTQLVYCLDRVPALVKEKPALATVEPFRTVLTGNLEAISKLSPHDFEVIAGATLSGMSVDAFAVEVKKWNEAAKDRRWKRPFTELTYLPMQEVLKFLDLHRYRRRPGFRADLLAAGIQHSG
jgi:hypothetical protein